jgi:starch-binding outer membrane protein, SusD/RagB family
VLLWEAEALIELGRMQEALAPLETVRARARAQTVVPGTLPAITSTNQATLRQAVRRERQTELGFELHRFFDLVRWGIAAESLPGFQKGKHEVFPIPQTEIDLNPSLIQNPNY